MKSRKIIAILLTLALTFCFGFSALAATSPVATQAKATIVVKDVTEDTSLALYKIIGITQMYDSVGGSNFDAYAFAPGLKASLIAEYGLEADASDYAVAEYLAGFSSAEMAALAELLYTWAVNNGLNAETAVGTFSEAAGTLTYSGLQLGYYLIVDTTAYDNDIVSSFLMLDTANSSVDVTLKTELTDYTVPVKLETTTGSKRHSASTFGYQMNNANHTDNVVGYSIAVDIPDFTKFTDMSFSVVDTMSPGLKLAMGTNTANTPEQVIKVTLGGVTLDPSLYSITLVGDDSYGGANADTFARTETIITIDFGNLDETFSADDIGKELKITYNCVVRYGAVEADGVLVNTVYVTENGEELYADPVTVYTYGLEITKTDEDGNPLEGAQFIIYFKNSSAMTAYYSTIIPYVDGSGNTVPGVYVLTQSSYSSVADSNVNRWTTVINNSGKMTTNSEGKIILLGLEDNTYYIKETKAPAGYNALTADIQFKMIQYNEDTNPTVYYPVEIVNYKGVELPSVGGIGTTLFIVFGCVIILGAGVLLFVNRKRVFGK